MEDNSTKMLAITVAIFFFTSGLSGTFLPIYFIDAGISVSGIMVIFFFMFLVVGLLPMLLIKTTRHFERIISLGILLTLLFYVALIYVKNPILLGLAYGLSMATFWPSFNLLQFRLTETKGRAFLMSLFSVAIPSITGIISPAIGGFVIETFGFTSLFLTSIILYFASFVASMKVRYKPESQKFSVPKNRLFTIFMVTFVLLALSECYWIAYPLFVFSVSSTILNVGFVVAASSLIMTFINLAINKLSDVKGTRVEFAVISSILSALWFFAIAYVSSMIEIIMLSWLSGFAGAFYLSWFAYFGDSFGREYHASILVMMEVSLMIGRMINLVPTYFFITAYNYAPYFIVLGLVSLLLTPFFVLSRKKENQ